LRAVGKLVAAIDQRVWREELAQRIERARFGRWKWRFFRDDCDDAAFGGWINGGQKCLDVKVPLTLKPADFQCGLNGAPAGDEELAERIIIEHALGGDLIASAFCDQVETDDAFA